MRPRLFILVLACLLTLASQRAMAAAKGDLVISVGESVAAAENDVSVRDEHRTEGGSYWRVGNDFQVFLAPDLPRGELRYIEAQEPEDLKNNKPGRRTAVIGLGLSYLVKVGQIKSIQYSIRTPTATPANVHLSLRLYTAPRSDPSLGKDDGPFFQRRLISEPCYVHEYRAQFPEGRWSTAQTDHPVSPLLWYDYPRTPAGWGAAPTLAQLQNGAYDRTWRDFIGTARGTLPEDTYALGDSVVRYLSVMTYHPEGSWKGFKGDLDFVRLELTTGERIVVDFSRAEGTHAPAGQGGLIAAIAVAACVFAGVAFVVEKKRRAAENAQ